VIPPNTASALPILVALNGDPSFDGEQLTTYELGYRTWPAENISLDMVAFLHDYDDLLSIEAGTPFLESTPNGPFVILPGTFDNKSGGRLFGLELAAAWRPLTHWQLQLAYTYLDSELDLKRGAETLDTDSTVPRHNVSLRSSHDLRDNLELDLWLRYVDELPGLVNSLQVGNPIHIDDYFALNLRLGWRPFRNLELALVGANLLNDNRLEFVQELYSFPTQVERSLYGQLKWSFR
jgi:iron complex outermembrane receptor protein